MSPFLSKEWVGVCTASVPTVVAVVVVVVVVAAGGHDSLWD